LNNLKYKPVICFFQAYYTDYIRSQTLLEGLKQHDVKILTCIVNEKSKSRYIKSLFRFLKTSKKSDVIIANFRSWEILLLLKLLTRKPLIYDAHISIWQSYCEERKKCKPNSLIGKILFSIDKLNCRIADVILIDTKTHAIYFSKTFSIPLDKFLPIYISCENSLFHPTKLIQSTNKHKTTLFWVGSGIPLQGLQVIVNAMKLISHLPVHLKIAGSSPIIKEIKNQVVKDNLHNITFLGRIPREQVVKEISLSDICLGGHYSSIPKAKNVIAGKLYEMIAMKKPVIAGDNMAIKELFTHKENVYLCKMGSPSALAKAISELHNSSDLRKKLALSAYELYLEKLRPIELTKPLIHAIVKLTPNRTS